MAPRKASAPVQVSPTALGRKGLQSAKNLPMCSLATKITKPQKTGDAAVDIPANTRYTQYVDAVNTLDYFSQFRQEAIDFVFGLAEKETTLAADDAFPTVATMGQLDPHWVATYVAEKMQVHDSTMKSAKEKDPKVHYNILGCLTHSSLGAKMPAQCIVKERCRLTLDERIREVGNRHVAFLADGVLINPNGTVNWGKFVYKAEFKGPKLAFVTHRPTKTKVDVLKYNIDASYELRKNWSDKLAEFFLNEVQRYPCHTFFSAQTGPHLHEAVVGKAARLQAITDGIQVAELKSTADVAAESAEAKRKFMQPSDVAVERCTKRAREALKARMEEVAKGQAATFSSGGD